MNLSKLSASEKLAVYGAVATVSLLSLLSQ